MESIPKQVTLLLALHQSFQSIKDEFQKGLIGTGRFSKLSNEYRTRRLEILFHLKSEAEKEDLQGIVDLLATAIHDEDDIVWQQLAQQLTKWVSTKANKEKEMNNKPQQTKTKRQIFLSYANEDEVQVEKIYHNLCKEGFQPWMATKDILSGEKWKDSIKRALRQSDFIIICISSRSITKRSFLQREIKIALDLEEEMLDSDIYMIPVRLEECTVPERLRDFQWVDLFVENGWTRLMKALQVGVERRLGLDKGRIGTGHEHTSPLPQQEFSIEISREEQRVYLEEELAQYQQNLVRLKMQKAKFGIRVPTDLLNEIQGTDNEIERIKREVDDLY